MKVYKISPRGYCFGVINAIKIAKESVERYPDQKIYILGMIVHNQFIVDALKNMNIITIDIPNKTRLELLDYIDEGVVILTAHGSSQEVTKKALAKGLIVVDATCKDVIKTHDLIKNKLEEGYEVIYAGKNGHPESEGALSIDPLKVHLVVNKEDVDHLDIKSSKILLTNQTTLSVRDLEELYQYILMKFPQVEFSTEICNATRIRQEAIINLPYDVNVVYVVGDKKSHNTTKLVSLARENKNVRAVYQIETINDINIQDLKSDDHIGITSGASTPTYLTNLIIDYLQQLDLNDPQTIQNKPEVEFDKILK